MDEELADDLTEDMDFHFNKVKCQKIEQVFDYETLKNSTCSMEIGYDDVKTVMNGIFPSLMPQLDRYKDRVLKSAYYWLYKDPLYLKLVITTDIPNGKDYSELCEYGR